MGEGGRVQLFVNPTNDTAVVPDVAGMTAAEARQALEAEGFQVIDSVTEQNDDVQEGRVVRTEPAAGEEVNVQEPITLFVAGPGVAATDDEVDVPYVIESSEAEARRLITDAGLAVEVNYIDRPFGDRFDDIVMDQNPRVGDSLPRGATVTINVGRADDTPPQTNPPQTNPPQTNPPQTNPPQTNPPQTNPPQTTAAPTTPAPAPTTTTPAATTTSGP
jgi:serine/threonine-protein kinase